MICIVMSVQHKNNAEEKKQGIYVVLYCVFILCIRNILYYKLHENLLHKATVTNFIVSGYHPHLPLPNVMCMIPLCS